MAAIFQILKNFWTQISLRGFSFFDKVKYRKLIKDISVSLPKPTATFERIDKRYKQLVNIDYNQRRSKIPSAFRKNHGLELHVKEAQKRVAEQPFLIASTPTRNKFLGMSAKRAAAYLCNTVTKWLHCCEFNDDMPDFPTLYIDAVNRGALTWTSTGYTWQFERALFGKYTDNFKNSGLMSYKDYTKQQMINRFLKSDRKFCLIRIKTAAGGHTFMGIKNKNEIYMYDTYHNHWSGLPLSARKCRVKYIYWFF